MLEKVVKLNNGILMPRIGLGTYKSTNDDLKNAVKYAISIGYRLIDTAWFYGNEKEIGEALLESFQNGSIKREDLFIVTKLWNNYHDKKNVVPKLKESLDNFKLNYVDLFLIHWPFGIKEESDPLPDNPEPYFSDIDYLETWEGMEECLKLGLTKSIGVSNFNKSQLIRLLKNCKIKPVVNQIEVNPRLIQTDIIEFCKKNDIVVIGFSPLERLGNTRDKSYPTPTVLDPKVIEIGHKYGKTAAQVILRYLLHMDVVVIPKSTNESRIMENLSIFDFNLNDEEISYLKSKNGGQYRVSGMTAYKNHKYYPF